MQKLACKGNHIEIFELFRETITTLKIEATKTLDPATLINQADLLSSEYQTLKERLSAVSSPTNFQFKKAEMKLDDLNVQLQGLLPKLYSSLKHSWLIDTLRRHLFEARTSTEASLEILHEKLPSLQPPHQPLSPVLATEDPNKTTLTALKTLASLSPSVPVFNGNILDFPTFKEIFTQCVHELEVPDVNKLETLKSKLGPKMKSWITPHLVNRARYQDVWKALVNEYTNPYHYTMAILDKRNDIGLLANDKPEVLQPFIQSVEAYHAALSSLPAVDLADILVYHTAARALPAYLHRTFYDENIAGSTELPSLRSLLTFLQSRLTRNLAVGDKTTQPSPLYRSRTTPNHSGHTHAIQVQMQPRHSSCFYCSQRHQLFRCPSFLRLPFQERKNFVEISGVCENCLGGIHSKDQCRSVHVCYTCKNRHHSTLHDFGHPDRKLPEFLISKMTFGSSPVSSRAASPDHQTIKTSGQRISNTVQYRSHPQFNQEELSRYDSDISESERTSQLMSHKEPSYNPISCKSPSVRNEEIPTNFDNVPYSSMQKTIPRSLSPNSSRNFAMHTNSSR